MAIADSALIERELRSILGDDGILPGSARAYLTDATESRSLRGRADAVALPADAAGVAAVVALVLRARGGDRAPRRRHRLRRRRRPDRRRGR